MGIYVLTGGATGIGAATKNTLQQAGHQVLVIDVREGDIQANLIDHEQRKLAITTIIKQFPEGIDGFIPCAGLGPHSKPTANICHLNYFAVIDMALGLQPLLKKRQGTIVLVSSNSAAMSWHNQDYLNAMLNNEETTACSLAETLNGQTVYSGSKLALTQWMRNNSSSFASQSIRINAVAPGIISTPLTDSVLQDNTFGKAISDFSKTVPLGRVGKPEEVANVISFLLSANASYITGSVIFVDGGHDALLRPQPF